MHEFNLTADPYRSDRLSKAIIGVFGILFIFAFSPLIAYLAGVTLLFFQKRKSSDLEVKLIAITSIFSASAIVASRAVAVTDSDDMIRYFELYQQADVSDYFANIFEIGIRVLYFFMHAISAAISIKLFIFFHCLIITLIFLGLVYKVIENSRIKLDSRFISVSLLLFSYTMTTQLFRYFIAVLLLSYILMAKNKLLKFILFGSATLFHLASPFIFLFYRFAMRPGRLLLLFAVPAIAFISLDFNSIAGILIGSFIPGLEKLSYSVETSGFDLPSIFSLISVSIYFMLVQLLIGDRIDINVFPLRRVMIISLLFGVILLPIAGLPMRLLFPITSIYNGMIMAIIITRFSYITANFAFLFLLLFKAYSLSGLNPDPNFMLWTEFNPINYIPFYYFF